MNTCYQVMSESILTHGYTNNFREFLFHLLEEYSSNCFVHLQALADFPVGVINFVSYKDKGDMPLIIVPDDISIYSNAVIVGCTAPVAVLLSPKSDLEFIQDIDTKLLLETLSKAYIHTSYMGAVQNFIKQKTLTAEQF